MDRRDRINRRFFIGIAVLLLLILGFNVYKHVRYWDFTLIVQGHHTMINAQGKPVEASIQSGETVFRHLRTSWWGWKIPYAMDKQFPTGLWFRADPTVNGGLRLTPPVWGHFATSNLVVDGTNILTPGHWYRVNQNGEWDQIEFQWDH